MSGKPNQKLVALQAENWNLKHEVGTAVTLRKDSGDVIETTTRSEAYVCESGYPVIFLTGVSGYYLLDRVSPIADSVPQMDPATATA